MEFFLALSHNLEDICLYAEWMIRSDVHIIDTLADTFVSFAELWLCAIKVLTDLKQRQRSSAHSPSPGMTQSSSRGKAGHRPDRLIEEARSQIRATYDICSEGDKYRHGILLKKANAIKSSNETSSQGALIKKLGDVGLEDLSYESLSLPCCVVPTENKKYFVREDVMGLVRQKLVHIEGGPPLRSLALWGMGGIGKTQIALAYAHECIKNGVKAVFWVTAEESLDIPKQFTAIAFAMKMPGTNPDEASKRDKNKVLRWLQTTGKH